MRPYEERRKPDTDAAFEREQEPEERFIDRVKNRQTSRDRYFSGYTTFEELKDASGKTVRYREYTGDLFVQEIKRFSPVSLRIFYLTAYIAAVALFAAALILDAPSNRCWYTMMAALVTIAFAGLGIVAMVEYLPSRAELLDHQYKYGAKAFKRDLRFMLAGFALQFITMGLLQILDPEARQIAELYRLLLLMGSAGIILLIERVENSVIYRQIYSEGSE